MGSVSQSIGWVSLFRARAASPAAPHAYGVGATRDLRDMHPARPCGSLVGDIAGGAGFSLVPRVIVLPLAFMCARGLPRLDWLVILLTVAHVWDSADRGARMERPLSPCRVAS